MRGASKAVAPVVEPSFWDKLLDDDARSDVIQIRSTFQNVSEIKNAIARDLEALLNTRCLDPEDLLKDFPLARKSVLAYGIPDFTNLCVTNPDHQMELRKHLTDAIAVHEPRLANVNVSLDADNGSEKALRFRVDAILRVHPKKPAVTFDATLQLASHVYSVK